MNTSPPPSVCDASETRGLLAFDALVDAVRRAAVEVKSGLIDCPERLVVPLGGGAAMLSMPAVGDDIAIHKLITVTPRNAGSALPSIQGHVTILDKKTGQARLLLDGPTVTGRRTAAVSMLALDLFARGPVGDLLVIGTGAQAAHHVDALAALRPAVRVKVRGRTLSAAAAFCARMPHGVTPDDGATHYDVVIACTSSLTPVHMEPARRGTLIIAVGSFTPEAAEIAAATVRASVVYVDDPKGARHEAGDLIQAGVDWGRVRSLADVLGDTEPSVAPGPVVFKSVGCAAWDLAAARVAIAAAGR